MEWVFWISLLLLFYTYLGYPLWLYLRSRWRPRPVKKAAILPSVSVVMAVRNEEQALPGKLENLTELDYPAERMEIVIVSDGSADGTAAVLAARAGERLRYLALPEHLGKAAALNLGMQQARGEVVVFTDVRQWIEPQALRRLVANFADPSVGCASGEMLLGVPGGAPSTHGVGLYWQLEKKIRQWEGLSGSVVGATGALYAVRRELLVPLPPGTVLDDVFLPMHVVRQGGRVVFDAQARAWDRPSQHPLEFRRKVRTLAGNYQLVELAPWLLRKENRLRFEFVSHKLLRLLVPLALLGLLISSWSLAAAPFYMAVLALQSVFYLAAAVGLGLPVNRLGKWLSAPATFCLLNWAAVMGLAHFLRRREALWRAWVPTTSGRPTAVGK